MLARASDQASPSSPAGETGDAFFLEAVAKLRQALMETDGHERQRLLQEALRLNRLAGGLTQDVEAEPRTASR